MCSPLVTPLCFKLVVCDCGLRCVYHFVRGYEALSRPSLSKHVITRNEYRRLGFYVLYLAYVWTAD